MAYNKSTKDRSNVVHCSHQSERKPPPGVPAPKGGLLYLVLTAREPSALSSYNLSVIADAMPPPLARRGFGSPRKVNGFARGSPTRGAGAQRLRGCTKTGLPSAARPALLRHIGNAPVHWHEETFSSGDILLSDENATVFLTSSDLQPVAPTQTATLNAICFFFNRIKIFQASIP